MSCDGLFHVATGGAEAAVPKAEEQESAPEPVVTEAPPPEPIRQAAPSTPPPGRGHYK